MVMADFKVPPPGYDPEPAPERKASLPAIIPKIRLIPFEQITIDGAQEEWTIKEITPREGIGLMWGPSQTYKSFIELDQDMHIALGRRYRGRRVQQGSVVYCAFEGGRGVSKRVEAWRQRFLPSDYADPVPFYLQPMRLDMVKQAGELIDAIETQTDGDIPVKISLDTLNRSIVGSESKDSDMSAYLAASDKLREAFHCFVNIIHHPGWDSNHSRSQQFAIWRGCRAGRHERREIGTPSTTPHDRPLPSPGRMT
jgi:RecA-family ATPase